MTNGMISIIVPVYNVEKYLPKTIRSVRGQIYENWELILIDDGSRDRSLDICKRAAERDSRIKFYSQENSGASSARNRGIDLAEGEYILFLDSDDWLHKNALFLLLNALKENGAQISAGSIRCVRPKSSYNITTQSRCISTDNGVAMAEFILRDRAIMYLHAKLFSSRIIKDNNIRFITNMKVAEDSCFVFTYLKYCGSVACIDKVLHNYNRLLDSSVSTKFYKDYLDWTLEKYKLQVELCNSVDNEEIRELYAEELKRIFVNIMVPFLRNVPCDKERLAKISEVMEKIHRELPEWLLTHSDDLFFEILADKDSEKMLVYLKEKNSKVGNVKALGTRQKLLGMLGKIKAWFIFRI